LENQMPKKTRRFSIAKEPSTIAAPSVAEPEIEVWDDPEWGPALSALQGWKKGPEDTGPKYIGKSDPGPIAQLLQSGKAVPQAVAKELGLWFDPPWGNKGPRLTAILPKRYYPGTSSIKSLIDIRRKVEQAKQNSKLEGAVNQVTTEMHLSRSHVMKAWALSDQEIVRRTSKFNPDPFLSPREPEQS
jgi:hypothetical protein